MHTPWVGELTATPDTVGDFLGVSSQAGSAGCLLLRGLGDMRIMVVLGGLG